MLVPGRVGVNGASSVSLGRRYHSATRKLSHHGRCGRMATCDVGIIGGGVIGINIATELANRYPDLSIVVLEKEKDTSTHASGRNSGVLHAGFYYTANSLKAKFTVDGNRSMTEFIKDRNLKLNPCGKLVVARFEEDVPVIDTLMERGKQNGVELELLTEKEAKQIEPRVRTIEKAIYSPNTSSADPKEVCDAMRQHAIDLGVVFVCDTKFEKKTSHKNSHTLHTNRGDVECGYVVNTGGLYADQIAKQFGLCEDYEILPFKGYYLYCKERVKLNAHIYPVPNIHNPFLGVHYTVTVGGFSKIGPTAIPALWRENYSWNSNFNAQELYDILTREMSLFFSAGFDFRGLAMQEVKKNVRALMLKDAIPMIDGMDASDFADYGKPGIRAQLVNVKKRTLEMDFNVEKGHNSIHVLNAVSPAWTCSIPFSKYVCDMIELKDKTQS